MKVKNSIKKVGAVAGSALLVGLTMGSAAMLSDYPQPFVGDGGDVASQIVVGSNGQVADVVGAVEIAASLGQAAVQTEERTATASGGSYGWSATNGVALDTRNDNLYFGGNINDVRQTLTADHLDVLADATFQDDSGTQTDIEYYLYPGQQTVQFGKGPFDSGQDPALYVDNPASVGSASSDHLYHLQANFENEIDFTDSTNVQNQDIELFGKSYVVSADSTASELVLLGSQDEVSLETGESGTITIDGSDHDVEVVAVTSGSTAAFRVDGELKQRDQDQTFNLDGQQVRVDTVIQTSSQNSEGLVTFAVGSEQLTLKDGEPVEDDNGDDIDGTHVEFQGSDSGSNGIVDELSGIDVYVGAEDDDQPYVMAGDSYSHSLFENIEFHFSGLNPDAADGNVGELRFATAGDDTVTARLTSSGDSATIEWATIASQTSGSTDIITLADDDNNAIVTMEGADVEEDEYFLSDAGDFAHMWQVTDIDVPASPASGAGNDEATVDIQDVVSGTNVEVDLDEHASTPDRFTGSEVIDGQTYYFNIPDGQASPPVVQATWGPGRTAGDAGDDTTLYPALDMDSGAALAFTNDVTSIGDTADSSGDLTYTLPSTESTDAQTLSVVYRSNGDMAFQVNGADVVGVDESGLADTGSDGTVTDAGNEAVINVGEVAYAVNYDVADSDDDGTPNADTATVNSIGLNSDGSGAYAAGTNANSGGSGVLGTPASLVIEPEDESDNEHAFVHVPGDGGDETDAGGAAAAVTYTGSGYSPISLESNDEVEVEYDVFGTYTSQDTDGQGTLTFNIPDGQAVAGAAFTGADGDLSAGGSGGSVTYTALAGMGNLPNLAMLDEDVTESVRSNNHLILVGGPAVNSLVSTLNDEGSVDLSEVADAQSGAVLQVVNDAFASGQHALVVAGYGADDTLSASRYLSDYADHQDEFGDNERLVLTEADYPSSQ